MADDEGRLTLDQFAEEMTAEQEAAAAPEAEQPEDEIVEPIEGETEEEPELEAEGDETEAEGEEEDEPEAPKAPVVERPRSWSKDDDAVWASLPPAAQLVVSKREADRDRAINIATSRAGQAEKQAATMAEQLQQWVPTVQRTFQDRWAGVDWAALARDNPLEYPQYKEAFEAEQRQVEHAHREASKASETAFRTFVAQEAAKLPEMAPELADPVKGDERRKSVAAYVVDKYGFDPETVRNISAAELTIAWKAKQWDDSQAKAKAAAAVPKKPPVALAPKAISPVSGQPVSPQRALQGLNERLTKKGGLDAFAALMTAEQQHGARKTVRR